MLQILESQKICAIIFTQQGPPRLWSYHAQPGGTFLCSETAMGDYPKKILNIEQQIQSFSDSGMSVASEAEAREALTSIGYFRLRGYCSPFYNNSTKAYLPGTSLSKIINIYKFDEALSNLVSSYLKKIEVSLRVRFKEAMLGFEGDPLVLRSPAAFSDKKTYWRDFTSVASEIARSNEVFIKHNFLYHEGDIPIWAAVEVMSFGTLSKLIKNLKTGKGSPYESIAEFYKFTTAKGHTVRPSMKMLSSWIRSLVVLRNMCAHNARIYNRAVNTTPEILSNDKTTPSPGQAGLYQLVMVMKYLRPSDGEWSSFSRELCALINSYLPFIRLQDMNFPSDWNDHFVLS